MNQLTCLVMYLHIVETSVLEGLIHVAEQFVGVGHVAMPHTTDDLFRDTKCAAQLLLQITWEEGREGGMEGGRDGGREGWREGGREEGMEGGREGVRDGGREGGMEGGMEGAVMLSFSKQARRTY